MKKLILLFLISLLIINTSYSSNKLDAVSRTQLSSVLKGAKVKNPASVQALKSIEYPFQKIGNKIYADLLLQLDNLQNIEHISKKGGLVNSNVDNIITAKIPVDRLDEILDIPGIIRAQAGRRIPLLLDSGKKHVRADLVHSGQGLDRPYKGSGVIVGVFDTGIDFTHDDFDGINGTRIQYLWDMGDTTGKNRPMGFDWGREYTKEQIDTDPALVFERDGDGGGGHGTHVTGTAAGGGKVNGDMLGMAPAADIIFVKGIRDPNSNGLFNSTDIIAGCQYIFQKAEQMGKPAVINLSLGSLISSHDGTSLDELALSALTGKGKIICAAGGNGGEFAIHAGADALQGEWYETLIMPINICDIFPDFCENTPNIFLTACEIWFDKAVIDSFAIGVYNFSLTGGVSLLTEKIFPMGVAEQFAFRLGDTTFGYMELDALTFESPGNGDGHILFYLSNNGEENVVVNNWLWTVRVKTAKSGRFDLWAAVPIPASIPVSGIGGIQLKGDNQQTVSNYATCQNVISVASYTSKNQWIDIYDQNNTESAQVGNISSFSSIGPTRDGRLCPVISAPGEIVFAPMSSHLNIGTGYSPSRVLQGGSYLGMQGTSMATPHVVGVIALMLEANPELDYSEIIEIFKKTAKRDEFTGENENNIYGYGKIDAWQAFASLTGTKDDNEIEDFLVYPNPASDEISVLSNKLSETTGIEIYNTLGDKFDVEKRMIRGNGYVNIKVTELFSGLYFLKMRNGSSLNIIPFRIIK